MTDAGPLEATSADLAYEERGAGEAIVLVHGHPFDRRMWRPQLESLSDAFHVIAPDLPGYGASDPREETMTMRALGDSVVELLDAIEVERAVFVGLSMGGLVSMEIGLAYPERAYGLVLAATTAAPVTPEEAASRRAVAADLEQSGMLSLALEMAGRLFGSQARRDPEVVLGVLEMMITAQPQGAAAALRGRAERPDYSRLLRDLRVPALVIAGDEDEYSPAPVTQQLVGSLPDPGLVLLDGIGHLPNLEDPARFDAALRSFAERVTDGSTHR